MGKYKDPRKNGLRELAPAAKGDQDAGSRDLGPVVLRSSVSAKRARLYRNRYKMHPGPVLTSVKDHFSVAHSIFVTNSLCSALLRSFPNLEEIMVDCYLKNEKQMGAGGSVGPRLFSCNICAKRGRHFALLRPVS